MSKGIFVVGTDTEVGKTVVSAGLCLTLRKHGINVGAMKPIATGCEVQNGKLRSADADFLSKVIGEGNSDFINPLRFQKPLAPLVASRMENKEVDLLKIKDTFLRLKKNSDFLIVEGIGGLLVPIFKNYFVRDLILDFGLPVLVVGRLGLGSINHTLMTIELIQKMEIPIQGFILNKISKEKKSLAEETNPELIQELSGIPLLGALPQVPHLSVEEGDLGDLEKVFAECINITRLMDAPVLSNQPG